MAFARVWCEQLNQLLNFNVLHIIVMVHIYIHMLWLIHMVCGLWGLYTA